MYSRRRRSVLTGVFLLSLAVSISTVLALFYIGKLKVTFMDFFVYYQVGDRVLQAGDIYLQTYPSTFSSEFAHGIRAFSISSGNRWLYIPISALAFVPFSMLPAHIAVFLWTGVSVSALIAGCWSLLSEHSNLSIKSRTIVSVSVILYYPLLLTLERGQVTTLLTAVLCFSASNIKNGNKEGGLLQNTLFIIPAAIKPFYMPYGYPLLINRKRLLKTLFAGGSIMAVSILTFGIESHINYVDFLLWGKTWGSLSRPPVSWTAYIFRPMYAILPFQIFAKAIVIALALVLIPFTNKNKKTQKMLFTVGILVIPIVAPMPNVFTLVPLIPSILLLVSVRMAENKSIASVVIGTSLIQLQVLYVSLPDFFPFSKILFESFYSPIIGLCQPALWGIIVLLYSSVSIMNFNI
jgi:hypothetical protein